MKGTNIGEFEELVLLTVASLGKDAAYAVSIKSDLEESANRKFNISAIHSSLYRMEDKGLLKSEFGGATLKRGGKKKRYFQVTSTGLKALQTSKQIKMSLWRKIPQLNLGTQIK